MKDNNKKLIENVKSYLRTKDSRQSTHKNENLKNKKIKSEKSFIKVEKLTDKIIEKEVKAWIKNNALKVSKDLISREIDKKFKK
tara:strand:- start:861 stop:1112 length:252 start_codon:yes stop_codon:yes gene_type:complete